MIHVRFLTADLSPRTSRPRALLVALPLALAAPLGCGGGGGAPDGGPVGDMAAVLDSDGDTLPDLQEGIGQLIDTDGDGVPDYLDGDSDNDGLLDRVEAGDADLVTNPPDSDGDDLADFRDLDSDDNGIPDGLESAATEDPDGDGLPNFADDDDDGDRIRDILEIGANTDFPVDTDNDGIPDFRDLDSDGDLIMDGDDGAFDSDGDLIDNRIDLDSDNDGIPDATEAGDDDLETPPIDTDGDRAPDFIDLDSDGDTLSDARELELGSDRARADTDGDGVDDFIAAAAETDLLDSEDNPRTRGDFVFVVPFQEPPTPRRDTLDFTTDIQFADTLFVFDISCSMRSVIEEVFDTVVDIVDELTCEDFGTPCSRDNECGQGQVCSVDGRCIGDPETTRCIASLWAGTGGFAGSSPSWRPRMLQAVTSDTRAVAQSLEDIGLVGGDENHFEAAKCMADRDFCVGVDQNIPNCAPEGIGCAGYRPDAVRMMIMFSDEWEQCADGACAEPNTAESAGMVLDQFDIFFVGVDNLANGSTQSDDIRDDFTGISRFSRSLNENGQPIFFRAPRSDPSTVGPAISDAIRQVTRNVPLLVGAEAEDEPDDAGDALQFIDHLEVNVSGEEPCTFQASTADLNSDTFDDAYPSALPGTTLCWDVVARQNFRVRPTSDPQVFRARIVVRAEASIVDTRVVWFVVPGAVDDLPFG
ncbi:MAG: hypothetical protein ACFCGT_05495 [Sandaracinaceae bacterium]